MTQESAAIHQTADRYLTFIFGDEEYGISIRFVQEIIGYLPTTPVPGSPPFVLGVINLRGAIVPVVDLRRRFGMAEQPVTSLTCIIVTKTSRATVGLLADRVCDVVGIPADTIQHPQTFGSHLQADYLTGIAAHQKGARILLDPEAVTSDVGLAVPAAE